MSLGTHGCRGRIIRPLNLWHFTESWPGHPVMAVCLLGHHPGQTRPASLGPWGEHARAEPGGEWGCLVVCLLGSHCGGCRWSWLKEWCNCLSVQSGHSGLGDGEVCMWGLLEASGGALLDCSCCPSNWCWHYHVLLLPCLLQGCKLLIREPSLGHILSSTLCQGWPGLGWRMGPWASPSSRQRPGCHHHTSQPCP